MDESCKTARPSDLGEPARKPVRALRGTDEPENAAERVSYLFNFCSEVNMQVAACSYPCLNKLPRCAVHFLAAVWEILVVQLFPLPPKAPETLKPKNRTSEVPTAATLLHVEIPN